MAFFGIRQVHRRRHPPHLQRRTIQTLSLSLRFHVVVLERCSQLGDAYFSETSSVEISCPIWRLLMLSLADPTNVVPTVVGCSRNPSELFRGIPIFFRHGGSSFLLCLQWRNVFTNARYIIVVIIIMQRQTHSGHSPGTQFESRRVDQE